MQKSKPIIQSNQRIGFVDPAVNAIIVQLKKELEEARKKKDEIQNELNSWKFNPEGFALKNIFYLIKSLLITII
jgi:hypothetical protein